MKLEEFELLNTVLKDDETHEGGTSYDEERLADIIEEMLQNNDGGILDIVNEYLNDAGIEKIKPLKEEG